MAGNASFRAKTHRSPARRSTNRNGPLPTGVDVERGAAHVATRRLREQVRRQNRELTENERERRLRPI